MTVDFPNILNPTEISYCCLWCVIVGTVLTQAHRVLGGLFIAHLSFLPRVSEETLCPAGAQVDLATLRCYWLSGAAAAWSEVRGGCTLTAGGELARVQGPDHLLFIQNAFPT